MNYKKYLIIAGFLISFFPFVDPPVALLFGIMLAIFSDNPYKKETSKLTHKMLQFSVVGLGFGMNAVSAIEAGKNGFIFTLTGIAFTFILGIILSKILKVERKTSMLISSGTAICGGSAIAAVAPVIDSENEKTSVALGVVFILNSVALLIFPAIGKYFNMSQTEFGYWAAIAIHDTSSVVGAAAQFGKEALQVATTVKLARALWIIPVTFIAALFFKSEIKKIKIPYFIFGFIAAVIINSYFTQFHSIYEFIYFISKRGLVATLFLIGTNLDPKTIRSVGFKPLLMGILLWVVVSAGSLLIIKL